MIFGYKPFDVMGDPTMVNDGKGGVIRNDVVKYSGVGYIDFQSDTDSMTKANTLYADATHILIWIPSMNPSNPFQGGIGDVVRSNGKDYYITYVDDVLNIGHHLEIPLREKPPERSV